MPRKPALAPAPPLENLLTEAQLAARYGLEIHTLRVWKWRGAGPHSIKVGRNTMYPESEVASWEASRPRG